MVLLAGIPCRLHEERKPPSLLRRKGRERHLPRVQARKFITLSCSSPMGPKKNFYRFYGPDPWKWAATVMAHFDDLRIIQFHLGGLVDQLNIPEFMEENEFHALNCHIHHSPSWCWNALSPGVASYNPNRSKASALPPSLRYLHSSFGSHVNRKMSPQGISSMLSMRMIEKRRGTYPSQYRLTNPPRKRPPMRLLMMSLHVTRTHRLGHHLFLVQFMRQLHTLTSLSALPDSSNNVFSASITMMLLYRRFVSTSTSYRNPHLANHLAMKDLWTNEPLPPPEYPPPPSCRLFSKTPVQGNSFIT
ncbi:hypothetical protein GOBAR_AA08115 [Gossypium barbadense]|uniref:Uncharacterized protein n=1 Tax=Gossypium barbadense TaxID=3634 RepID=A0A2P5YAB7_GOSBA|nr:hypothetical protein GOBAR_AA08115 [Gossypium barbadense]